MQVRKMETKKLTREEWDKVVRTLPVVQANLRLRRPMQVRKQVMFMLTPGEVLFIEKQPRGWLPDLIRSAIQFQMSQQLGYLTALKAIGKSVKNARYTPNHLMKEMDTWKD